MSAHSDAYSQGLWPSAPGIGLDAARAAPSIPAMPDTVLNLRGLRCPLPALKTRKALTRLAPGDRLVVECTDPLATIDIPNLLRETGDILEDNTQATGLFVFHIRKAGRQPDAGPRPPTGTSR
jgi:tRNA 2-thiouridine synthesizing protein A